MAPVYFMYPWALINGGNFCALNTKLSWKMCKENPNQYLYVISIDSTPRMSYKIPYRVLKNMHFITLLQKRSLHEGYFEYKNTSEGYLVAEI